MGLRSVANQYHAHASKIARRRADEEGVLAPHYAEAVNYYRDCAARVEALILPEDEEVQEAQWNLESTRVAALASSAKVTAKDKVANPKELIEKAG